MHKYRFGDRKSLILVSLFMFISAAIGGISIYALSSITNYAVAGEISKLIEISQLLLLVIVFELIFNVTFPVKPPLGVADWNKVPVIGKLPSSFSIL